MSAAQYNKLQTHIANHAYKAALAVCKQLHETEPSKETRWALISLLLVEGQAEKAGEVLAAEGLENELRFEHAYSLYRKAEYEAARGVIEGMGAGGETLPFQELLAQVMYKMEQYDEALMVYRSLLLNPEYGAIPIELKANYAAATVGSALGLGLADEEVGEGFELLYNDACRAIARGAWAEAEQKLNAALDVGRRVLAADGFTSDEVEDEVAVIRAQLGYVLQATGRTEEAADVYAGLVDGVVTDETVLAVANNNITCLRGDSDLFDSMKKNSKSSAEVLRRRLTKAQRDAIGLNRALLFMYMGKFDQCRTLAEELGRESPGSITPLLILAALHFREGKLGKVTAILNDAASTDPVAAQLALAQVAYLDRRNADVLAALESPALDPIRATPAFTGVHVALLEAAGHTDAALDAIDAALEANPDSLELKAGVADYLLARGHYARATMLYSALLAANPSSTTARAKLVRALAHADPDKAAEVTAGFPAIDTADLPDADALEAALLGARRRPAAASRKGKEEAEAVPAAASQDAAPAAGASTIAGDGPARVVKKKNKKKKKNPPPKNFDPDKKPSPFRWLAKRDRPDYVAPKQTRRQKRRMDTSTQGAAAVDGESSITPSKARSNNKNNSSGRNKGRKGRKGKRRK